MWVGGGVGGILSINQIRNPSYLPPFRHAFNDLHLLMTGKAQTHKPFAVNFLGHFFQQRDAPLVIFDQFVIGG
ncbi:MAG: hypothetical protein V9G16_05345 [Nitrosomonas sp.]